MSKQANIVAAIHTAVDTSRKAAESLVNIWEALHTECEHYHDKECTMNNKEHSLCGCRVYCTFMTCPYTRR